MGSHRQPIPPKKRRTPRPNESGRFTGGGKYFILIFLFIVAVMAAWIYAAVS